MKKYIKPNMRVAELNIKDVLLTGSEGIATGQSLGNEYNSEDVSYSRDNSDLWDQEW